MTKERMQEEKEGQVRKPVGEERAEGQSADLRPDEARMLGLQQTIGNRAVQRLLAQRSGEGSFELDDETAGRIDQERGGGQPLDAPLQKQMGAAMGQDFGGVRVHAGSESDALNRQLNAKAFTTGQDIFFRQGAYDPGSGSGRELVAHELTHVVQQGSGAVKGGQKMTVNPPGDVYEQEADSIAHQAAHAGHEAGGEAAAGAAAQRQAGPEEEELQTKAAQRQPMEEEEEELQTKTAQRQPMEEEEELQAKAAQRQPIEEEEEELQTKAVQRQAEEQEEEEPVQAKAAQRQEEQVPEEAL